MSKKDDTFEMLDNNTPQAPRKSSLLLLILVLLVAVGGGISAYTLKQPPTPEKSDTTVNEPVKREPPAPVQESAPQPANPITAMIYFDENSAVIIPEQRANLKAFYQQIKDLTGTLQINGYTDNYGSKQSDLILSKQRAEAVSAALKSLGSSDKIEYVVESFGRNNPVGDNTTDQGRRLNRRVELKFTRHLKAI